VTGGQHPALSAPIVVTVTRQSGGLLLQLGRHTGDWKKCARFGYSLEVKMTRILKRKDFARWQAGEKLPDAALCKAVKEMEKRSDRRGLRQLPLQEAGGPPRRWQERWLPHACIGPDR
jgi:Protein of unknown function (DUF1044).